MEIIDPAYQGELDGLCGMYAIANVVSFVLELGKEQEIFEIACQGLSKNRWPEVLWEGTTFGDMQRMLRTVQDYVDEPALKVKYPFSKNTPKTNAAYWKAYDEIFSDPTAVCAIIGLWKPSEHWIVSATFGKRERIYFIDSTAELPFDRKNRTSLHAGNRLPKGKSWLIDRKELIVFHMK